MQVCSLRSIHAHLLLDIRFLGLVTVPVMGLALNYSVVLLYITSFDLTHNPKMGMSPLTRRGSERFPDSPRLMQPENDTAASRGSKSLLLPPQLLFADFLTCRVPTELSARDTKEYKTPTAYKRDI